MVVLLLNSIPDQLRYDVTRWLNQVGVGVYVGDINVSIREKLWTRVMANIKEGEAVMIWSTNREQGYDFYIYNTRQMVVDLDGFKTLCYPWKDVIETRHTSVAKSMQNNHALFCKTYAKSMMLNKDCVIVDIETTGVDSTHDTILEIGALRIRNHEVVEKFHMFVKQEKPIPSEIVELTKITDEMVAQGCSLSQALTQFREFIDRDLLVGWNIKFDMEFIQQALRRLHGTRIKNAFTDVLLLMKKLEPTLTDYRLESVIQFLQNSELLDTHQGDKLVFHRALNDCEQCRRIYELLYHMAKS